MDLDLIPRIKVALLRDSGKAYYVTNSEEPTDEDKANIDNLECKGYSVFEAKAIRIAAKDGFFRMLIKLWDGTYYEILSNESIYAWTFDQPPRVNEGS